MRDVKDIYLDHLMDFIIRSIPMTKLIKTDEKIMIGSNSYNIGSILSKTYYHPIDLIRLNPTPANAISPNDYITQFYNNLYMLYSSEEMDFIMNNIKYNSKKFSSNPQLNFFPEFTSDFIKYRLSHNNIKSNIRGCRILKSNTTDIVIEDESKKYMLACNSAISVFITKYMSNYLMLTDEDEYDFYVLYYPFIKYFIISYMETNNYKPNLEVYDLKYYNTVKTRHDTLYGDNFYNYINENSEINESNYKYLNNIYANIFLYNLLPLNKIEFIDTVIRNPYSLLIDYRNYIINPSLLFGLKGLFFIRSRNYDATNDEIHIAEYIISIISAFMIIINNYYISDVSKNINNEILEEIYTYKGNNIIEILNNVSNIFIKYGNSLNNMEYTYTIENIGSTDGKIKNNVTQDSTSGSDQLKYNNFKGIFRDLFLPKIRFENISALPKDIFETDITINITTSDINPNDILTIKNGLYLYTLALILDNIKKELNDKITIELNKYIRVTDTYRDSYKNKVQSIFTFTDKINIKEHIKNNLVGINSINLENCTNYKCFISLLPTIYYSLFNKPKPVKIKIVNPDVVNPKVPTVRFDDMPVDDSKLQPMIEENISNNENFSIFWDGIEIDDYEKIPLYLKSIINDCSLLLCRVKTSNGEYCTLYNHEIIENEENITHICILPYPYSSGKTMYDIFSKLTDKIMRSDSSPYYGYRYTNSDHIGLNKKGNAEFINKLSSCNDIGDVIKLYILVSESNSGTDKIELSDREGLYFAVTLLDVMGLSPRVTKRNIRNGMIYYLYTNRPINANTFMDLLSKEYKSITYNNEISRKIINIIIPIINYLRTIMNASKMGKYTASAGSNDNIGECSIVIKQNPIDMVNKMDFSFIDSDNISDIMNKDIFNIDNDTLKSIILYSQAGNNDTDIIDIIYDNIPQSLYIKSDIYDKIYSDILGGASINEILQNIDIECTGAEFNDEENTKEFLKKIIKLIKKSNSSNLNDNANITKSQILSSINTVFDRYSCPDRLPIQYLANVRLLLKQFQNDGIKVSDDVKINIRNTIHSIYLNTMKFVKTIAVFSACVDIVKAYKRLNRYVDDSIIDEEFIRKICDICKDNFYKYTKNVQNVYKNIMYNVFPISEHGELRFDIDDCDDLLQETHII